jgi:demethylmenaquinone methyltransferase/2-methoxy-6-polyprenyl-1,4-benzoquinol methylase
MASPTRPHLPGTRPEGSGSEREAARAVREMFTRITPRYDLLNHLLSFSLDRLWRRRAARRLRHVLARADARVLDLCCGTGDLALALAGEAARAEGAGAEILGADFVFPMLVRARAKSAGAGKRVEWLAADALRLPLADASCDLVTAAFGFRNLANYRAGLEEMRRVLRPGGEIALVEFSEPRGLVAPLYRFYFTRVLPRIGGWLSGSGDAYRYLPASVEKFPTAEALAAMLRDAGFRDVGFERWAAGAVAFHRGTK